MGSDSMSEFEGRCPKGLQDTKDKVPLEDEERAKYFRMYGKLIFLQAPAMAWGVYLLAKFVLGLSDMLSAKFTFIHTYGLGWVYLAWFLIYCSRVYAAINSNGARAPARLDRPDQHIYRLMHPDHNDKPYVLMAGTGPEGRFNRAQRAAANMDESLPIFISGLMMNAVVFGPISVAIAALYMFGSVKFCNLYKENLKARGAGFMPKIIAESLSAALCGVCAVKGILGPLVPV